MVACVGGGSNAIGIFSEFTSGDAATKEVRLVGVEPGGTGIDTRLHGAVLSKGEPGCLHGMKSMVMQDEDGQILETHSIAAGLDYPSVGPEHAHLKQSGRVSYIAASDREAVEAFMALTRQEGIIPALESSHALAGAKALAAGPARGRSILVNLSGRGDKDLDVVAKAMEEYGISEGGA